MAVLGSGSGGNSIVLECGVNCLLIDAGLSAKQLVLRLEHLGIAADTLTGILLTHEHSDHVKGLDVLLRQRKVPVYANAMTKEVLHGGMKSEVEWKIFNTGETFQIDGLEVQAFPIPHDAAEPVGYVIQNEYSRLGVVTDVGYVTQSMKLRLRGSHGLFVESNYDEAMLDADTKRPWATKQRIASRHGHLSNKQAGELIAEVGCEKLSKVVLGHLSSDCNCPKVASQTVRSLLENEGLGNVDVHCAHQNIPTEWIEFGDNPLAVDLLDRDLSQGSLF